VLLNDSVCIKLLHSCVDEICGRPGPSYHKFVNSMDWSRAEYEGIYKLMSMLLRNPASLYMIEEKVAGSQTSLTTPRHGTCNRLNMDRKLN